MRSITVFVILINPVYCCLSTRSACVQIVCYEEFISISVRLTFLDLIDSVTVWHIGKGKGSSKLQFAGTVSLLFSIYLKLDCI